MLPCLESTNAGAISLMAVPSTNVMGEEIEILEILFGALSHA